MALASLGCNHADGNLADIKSPNRALGNPALLLLLSTSRSYALCGKDLSYGRYASYTPIMFLLSIEPSIPVAETAPLIPRPAESARLRGLRRLSLLTSRPRRLPGAPTFLFSDAAKKRQMRPTCVCSCSLIHICGHRNLTQSLPCLRDMNSMHSSSSPPIYVSLFRRFGSKTVAFSVHGLSGDERMGKRASLGARYLLRSYLRITIDLCSQLGG